MASLLSKTDFKIARSCITKLYYKKKRYPSGTDSDPFMELLAEGGYMVGKLAQILYPGITIERMEGAAEQTRELLRQGNVCIHEATIESKGKIVRIDILNKKGRLLELIEVKSKSWDSAEYNWDNKQTRREFKEYLEDVAYQYYVLHEAFPDYEIKPYLFLPDKAKRTTIEGLNGQFSIKTLPETKNGFKGFEVSFTGDVDALRKDDIMTLVPADKIISEMQEEIKAETTRFLSTLNPEIKKEQEQISINCRDCEYWPSKDEMPNGFAECWGKNANIDHHILELTQLGNINRSLKGGINEKIARGFGSYKDLDAESFIGKYNDRPYYQVTAKKEIILPDLFAEINFKYPIAYIDFEVSKMALPYHKGMRPYENVAFQWSCHTQHNNGKLTHAEWINTNESYPNFQFAESLMEHISDAATVLIWSPYENIILKDILEQMDIYGYDNPALKKWLEEFVRFDKEDSHGYIDQAAIANKYYHHPLARGKYGIKWILPAVLQETKSPTIISWLKELNLYGINNDGSIKSPYDLLPVIEVDESTTVKDGTGAVRAYQDMMFGRYKNDPKIKAKLEDALRQYCRLDTMAMVIILEYWRSKSNPL
jgi:hypothetical protein